MEKQLHRILLRYRFVVTTIEHQLLRVAVVQRVSIALILYATSAYVGVGQFPRHIQSWLLSAIFCTGTVLILSATS